MSVAGITTETDQSGNYTNITIDVKQHKEVIPVLQQMGLLEKHNLKKTVKKGQPLKKQEHTLTNLSRIFHGENRPTHTGKE
jgi:ClpP class serine protease